MRALLLATVLALTVPFSAIAQDEENASLLIDRNGDGIVTILAFGDSLTFGIGDQTPPGQFIEEPKMVKGGYPARLASTLGVSVINGGVPGEQLVAEGIVRFPGLILGSGADLVLIFEGANDAVFKVPGGSIERALQRAVNIAHVLGVQPVLVTIPPRCCNAFGPGLFTDNYNVGIGGLGFVNEVPIVDIDRAWSTTCQNKEECELYNVPEGIHPNSLGYEVIAQTMMAALLGIDIFAEGGALELEEALGLAPGTVIVKPELQ